MNIVSTDSTANISNIERLDIPFGDYIIDPSHSKIGFEVTHLIISSIEGRFKNFIGSLTLEKQLFDSKVEVNVEIASIDTAENDRDNHLRSSDFFDSEKFPQMNFTSTSFAGSPEFLKVKGKLTIKGITRDIVFEARLSKEITDPWGKKRVAISGTAQINRQDFGLSWNKTIEAGQVVGDQVTILIKAEAVKK